MWTPPSPTGNDVLHGVVVHPDFATNRLVYVSYLKGDDSARRSRSRAAGSTARKLVDAKEIFVADAWENARMAFTAAWSSAPTRRCTSASATATASAAARRTTTASASSRRAWTSDVGKILRLTDDGRRPKDNPFVGRAGAKPEIFTYGHRNSYGLRFHPVTGELWQMEIGPQGGDEVNILKPGANYGWPLVSLGRNYSGTLVSEQAFHRDGMEDPVIFWTPQISPAAMAFYTGDKFPQWQNSLIIGALSGQHVERMPFNDKGQPLRREEILERARRALPRRRDRAGRLHLFLDGSPLRQRPARRRGDPPRAGGEADQRLTHGDGPGIRRQGARELARRTRLPLKSA